MTGQALKSNYQYSLSKETYAVEDAREFLMALLAGITRFHSLNTLRTWERTGAKDESSEKGIEELSKMRKNILNMLKEMDEEKLSIEIDAEIKVTRKKV